MPFGQPCFLTIKTELNSDGSATLVCTHPEIKLDETLRCAFHRGVASIIPNFGNAKTAITLDPNTLRLTISANGHTPEKILAATALIQGAWRKALKVPKQERPLK